MHTDQEFLQTVDHFALILIKSETANYLIYAVGHVELVHIATELGEIRLVEGGFVERVLLGHLDEVGRK